MTTSIIRGNFHEKTIGKFYKYFEKYFQNYKIYHIINIDDPKNLQPYFNKYETIYNYYQIIPKNVNLYFINEPNIGFLNAYKKIITKIEELKLINNDYLYYWLEDDWEPRETYDINKLFNIFNYKNTSYAISKGCRLGSMRGGPFMTGSFFINIFNIKNYMNNNDPEYQIGKWLRNVSFHDKSNKTYNRLSLKNSNINNKIIHIINVFENNNIPDRINKRIKNEIAMYNKYFFDKSFELKYHIITYDSHYNLKYSEYKRKYDIRPIKLNDLNKIFDNLYIKHFKFHPYIMYDIGREFNKKYLLSKWNKSNNSTTYNINQFYNAEIGNNLLLDESLLRYKPECTENECFFTSLGYIHQCLPYFKTKYFDKNIFLNILYYSHSYGKYPNFNVFSDLIQLNYNISISNDNLFKTLNIHNIFKTICSDNNELLYNDNFELANKYWFDYFKFDEIITNEVSKFISKFNNMNVLGIHYEISENNTNSSDNDKIKNNFLEVIDNHLLENKYNYIFIFTYDKTVFEYFLNKNDNVICYNNNSNFYNLSAIKNNIFKINKQIKTNKEGSIYKTSLYERRLKQKSINNRILLQNKIINSLILSKCNFVLKTNSQLSAYSKVFNPKLNIFKINLCKQSLKEWPDSAIQFYE